jgi:hypothetical protein
MRITDIIRGVLDLVDLDTDREEPVTEPTDAIVALAVEPEVPDELAIIQQLAGLEQDISPEYANEPCETVAPLGAAFPKGDDMHQSKNPADIRTNAPSMYPGYQAEKR